ncbi:type II toxin-antitoxin system Phd/YefM family antitoxin [Pseudonocardia eucalypti]|uniref:Antitoxin n=1 Tax=Pseudonocardia eucalypti TaxID=648755 RepID=A0ABP9R476_9PSEU|nr:prevent-host-death family protein [Pseudonocardia eucalypti]
MVQVVPEPESIGIRELRQHASRYVALAEAGQRVPVTVRGRLVAYLVPAEEPTSMFERLKAAGQVREAKASLLDLLPPPPAEPGERSLSDGLLEMRDEERY